MLMWSPTWFSPDKSSPSRMEPSCGSAPSSTAISTRSPSDSPPMFRSAALFTLLGPLPQVDLHFVEIINTNRPKGMRVFNVYIQEEKVLSELDIFAVVGANKPVQLIDSRVSVKDNGIILIRFESMNGNLVISGISIRRAAMSSALQVTIDYIKCNCCVAQTEIPSSQSLLPDYQRLLSSMPSRRLNTSKLIENSGEVLINF